MRNVSVLPNDIRYRGPLTSRGLKLIALIAMSLYQFSTILIYTNIGAMLLGKTFLSDKWIDILSSMKVVGQITFPLMLIASLSRVMNGEETFRHMLVSYGTMALITYLVIVFFLSNFFVTILDGLPAMLSGDMTEITEVAEDAPAAENTPVAEAAEEAEDTSDEEDVLAFYQSLRSLPQNVLTYILRRVLPGDGMIHPDALNVVFEAMGSKITLPSQAEILSMCEDFGFDSETANALIGTLASIDPSTISNFIINFGLTALEIYGFDLSSIWTDKVKPMLVSLIHSHLNINVFWDLFLFSLFYFFIAYTPRHARGGKLLLFRCCAAFPALWLLLSAVIAGNLRTAAGISLPDWATALLAGHNFSSIAIFFLLVLFEKYRKTDYQDKHGSLYGWTEYRSSNRCSFYYSVFCAVSIIAISALDYGLSFIPGLSTWGIGKSSQMWIAAPILLLFSYTRKPRFKIFNAVIPLYYVLHYLALIILVLGILATGILLVSG